MLVKSSNIRAIDYHPELRALDVMFKNGTTYRYHEVTEQAAAALVSAESIGKHLAQHIKPNHEATKR